MLKLFDHSSTAKAYFFQSSSPLTGAVDALGIPRQGFSSKTGAAKVLSQGSVCVVCESPNSLLVGISFWDFRIPQF